MPKPAFTFVIVAASTLWTLAARADNPSAEPAAEPAAKPASEPAPDPNQRPDYAFNVQLGSGMTFPIAMGGLDTELRDAGYPGLSSVMPRLDLTLRGHLGRFALGLHLGGTIEANDTDLSSYSAGGMHVTAGYQVLERLPFGITPSIGIGYTNAVVSLSKPSLEPIDPNDSVFRQVIKSPGPDAGLSTDPNVSFRASVALDYDLLWRSEQDGTIGGLRFSVEPGIEIPVRTTEWNTRLGGERLSIDGPAGPPIHPFIGFSVGVLGGI